MRVVVVAPAPDPAVEEALVLAGAEVVAADDPEGTAPACAVVDLGADLTGGIRAARDLTAAGVPVVVVIAADRIGLLEAEPWWDDFVTTPVDPMELRLRVRRLAAKADDPDRLSHDDLVLDTATYQASVGGTPVDLTFMEYELLRFFVQHRGRVWSREQLLSRVWGYEYYGGARTVDVHVRRLRAKLGEERSGWITTVRSVGYRFG